MNQNPQTFGQCLSQWMAVRCLNRKPKTSQFYSELHAVILREWPDLSIPADDVTAEWLLAFATTLAHLCPSRWNSMVSALREITPHGKLLSRRPLNSRQFEPPNQQQFAALIAECDAAPRSKAGLVVRFLSLTGMRISEARALRWKHVHADCIQVPGETTKSGKPRAIPLLPGAADVLARLRALDSGGYVLPRQSPRKAIENASRRVFGVAWSFHCFRHLFATRCIESLVDMPTVARWLGHQDGGALLARTYFHLVDDHSRTMAARVVIV